jgi:protein arginine kinase activator
MKCDICNENEAVIFVHQVIMGKQAQVNLCEHCAHERGIHTHSSQEEMTLQTLINEIKAAANLIQQQLDPRVCPVCGTSIFNIRRDHAVGCPECYHFFRSDIKDIMENSGILGHYSGSVPPRLAQFRSALNDKAHIREKMEECVASEDYEGAALYRDQLRQLESGEGESDLALVAEGEIA